MSFNPGGTQSERDVMANLAKRLMGLAPNSPSPTVPVASPKQTQAPHAMPISHAGGNASKAAAPRQTTKGPAASPAKENLAPPSTPIAAVKKAEALSTHDTNGGPVLKGTADQLAAAHEFAQSATQGRSKSNPGSRNGRQRLLSKEPSLGSISGASTSSPPKALSSGIQTRSMKQSASLTSNPGAGDDSGFQIRGTAQRANQTLNPTVKGYSGATASAARHDKGPVTLTAPIAPTPAPTLVQSPVQSTAPGLAERWKAFTANPSTTTTESDEIDNTKKEVAAKELAGPSTSSPSKKDETEMRPSWQLNEVTNTLKARAGHAAVPPHLRARVAAAGIPDKKGTVAITSTQGNAEDHKDSEKAKDQTKSVPQQNSTLSTSSVKELATPKKAETKTDGLESGMKDVPVVVDSPVINVEPTETPMKDNLNAATDKIDNAGVNANDNTVSTLKELEAVVAQLKKRVASLEKDGFASQKQLEVVTEADERRKFLGTDSAKTPFGLEVKCPNDKTYTIQVSGEMKIYDLIRRIRVKADLAPPTTLNPRILVEKKAVGHGMTLSEVGISRGKVVAVVFTYDGA